MSVANWVRACVGTAVIVLSLAACGSSPSVTEGSSNVSDAGAPASDSTDSTDSTDSIDSIDSTDSTPAPVWEVGDTGPGGGIVFYVNEANATGSRYLEAAPNTWSGGSPDPNFAWCSNTATLIPGTFGDGFGTGKSNTDLMLAGSPAACTSGAAVSVRAYTGGGVSWFLPSKDELRLLYYQQDVVGGFAGVDYWSSSQGDAGVAWSQSFVDGYRGFDGKSVTLLVRPVRAF